MTHRQSCNESLHLTPTGATPEILFREVELSQGKTIITLRHSTSASMTELPDQSRPMTVPLLYFVYIPIDKVQ